MASSTWQKFLDEATSSAAVPASTYDVRVKKAKYKAASTGKHGINIQYEIVSGPHAGSPLWDNVWFSPDNQGAQRFFFGNLAVLGADSGFFAQMPIGPEQAKEAMELIAEHITGAYATVDVAVGEFNGMPKNDITAYKPYAGPSQATAPEQSAESEERVPTPAATPQPQAQPQPATTGGAKPPF